MMKKKFSNAIILVLVLLWVPLVCVGFAWIYTKTQLAVAKTRGVYESAEAGMRVRIEEGYVGIQKLYIENVGPNFPNGKLPHVWFVTARVYADKRADGRAVGNERNDFDFPGSFFIKTGTGWVWVPEGAFPVLLGKLMEFFRITE